MQWIEMGENQDRAGQRSWSLAVKFGLLISVMVLLVILTLTLFAVRREQQTLRIEFEQHAEILLDTLASVSITPQPSLNAESFSEMITILSKRQETLVAGYLYDDKGRVLAEFFDNDAVSREKTHGVEQQFHDRGTTKFTWLPDRCVAGRAVSIDDHVLGAISLQFSTTSFQRNLAEVRTAWIGTALVVTLVSVLSVIFMSRIVTQSSRIAEESLRKLEKAFATTEVGITISDNDGRIVYTNPADAAMHGYTVNELIGQPATLFAPPEYQEVSVSEEETKGFFHWKRERINVRKDGSRFPVRLISNPITDPLGRSLGKVVVCEDITEYKQAEAALQEEHSLLHTLINNLPDTIYVKDTKSRYLLANIAMVRTMAVESQDELLGKTDFDFQPLDTAEHSYADEQAILDSGRPLINREEPVISQRSGNIHWVLSTKVPFHDNQGAVLGIIGINRDITDRKRMEAQILTAHTELKEKNDQLAKLNASKDKFFSIISHDLRSPLNVILGYSETLEHELKDVHDARMIIYIQGLREAAEKLYTLLENLLTWSRIQRGDMVYSPRTWNLNDITAENTELLCLQAEQKQITFRNSVASDIMVYADFHMVNAILRNLLTNALKFTNSGGHVEISARQTDAGVEVTVSDTGVGIQKEDIPKLFRIDVRYTHAGTAGEEGTGLGLSLCKELVEKNNGTIWVESEIGRGTTFYFTLPCPSEEEKQSSQNKV